MHKRHEPRLDRKAGIRPRVAEAGQEQPSPPVGTSAIATVRSQPAREAARPTRLAASKPRRNVGASNGAMLCPRTTRRAGARAPDRGASLAAGRRPGRRDDDAARSEPGDLLGRTITHDPRRTSRREKRIERRAASPRTARRPAAERHSKPATPCQPRARDRHGMAPIWRRAPTRGQARENPRPALAHPRRGSRGDRLPRRAAA